MTNLQWKELLESKMEEILDRYGEEWIAINTDGSGQTYRFILWEDGDISVHCVVGNHTWLAAESEGRAICVLEKEGNTASEDGIVFSDFLEDTFSRDEIESYQKEFGYNAIWDREAAEEFWGEDRIQDEWERYCEEDIECAKNEFWIEERDLAEEELWELIEHLGEEE